MGNYEKEMNQCHGQNGNCNETMHYLSSSLHSICMLFYIFSGQLSHESTRQHLTTETGKQPYWDFRIGLLA